MHFIVNGISLHFHYTSLNLFDQHLHYFRDLLRHCIYVTDLPYEIWIPTVFAMFLF